MSELSKMRDIFVASNKADREERRREKEEADDKLRADFATLNFEEIRTKSDKDLAEWQSKYPVDSPQFILASQVWNNRAITKQMKWVRFAAIVGPIATIIAALIGYYLGNIQAKNRQQALSPPAIVRSNKIPVESEDLHSIKGSPLNHQTENRKK